MRYDILIRNGTILDPALGISKIGTVAIQNDKIAMLPDVSDAIANYEIDADGMFVLPGLIDFHAHVFSAGTDFGVEPAALLSTGVTSVVDAGSSGTANYASFRLFSKKQPVRIRAFLNVSPTGITTLRQHESVDPAIWDEKEIAAIFEKYGDQVLGLKIRQSQDIVCGLGLEPLRRAVALAEEIGCPVVVHTTDPPESASEMADILRPGDVYCHVYQGAGKTILEDGAPSRGIAAARERGVLFDAANGMSHFNFDVAERALKNGFAPDIISSDVTKFTFLRTNAYALPYLMSKYLYLGMSFIDVVRAVTETPARLMGMAGKIGTLAPGAYADVTILKQKEARVRYRDAQGCVRESNEMLVPQMTIKGGRIMFRQMDFCAGFDYRDV